MILKSSHILNSHQRKLLTIGVIAVGIIVIVGAIALAMSQWWCEPCKVIKLIGG